MIKKKKKMTIIIVVIIILTIVIRLFACSNKTEANVTVGTVLPFVGELEETINTSGVVSSEEQKIYFAKVNGVLDKVNVAAGDTVKNGSVLISYDMEKMERMLKEAELTKAVSLNSYNSTIQSDSKSQSKLQESTHNLGVLDQQIADYEAYLETLQTKLETNQRETSNSLAAESYQLSASANQIQKEMSELDPASAEYEQKAIQLQEITLAQSHNGYLQQVALNSDYAVDLQKEIDSVSKNIMSCKEYKAEMESQKMSSENGVLDSYQKDQYAANNEIAAMAYQQSEENYQIAQQGIVAEFDGIVLECMAVEGSTVMEGSQLLTIADSNNIKVRFHASKHDLTKLKEGQKANVIISGNVYEGEISKINRMATTGESGTPMVLTEIHILNPDDNIILGLDAKLEIFTNKAENALLIPVEAINADKDGDFLFVVEEGKVIRKSVICGISSDTYVEVKEGLSETDHVILSSYSDLYEGMAVTESPIE